MYVDIKQARHELQRRVSLRDTVEAWWRERGWGLPPMDFRLPTALFARHVATYRYEDAVFDCMARSTGLSPLWIEYLDDRMCSGNEFKRSLCAPKILERVGRKGGFLAPAMDVADVSAWETKPLRTVRARDGRLLADLHHSLHDKLANGPRVDCSEWLGALGGKAALYYEGFISLFVAHAVLVEDYDSADGDCKMGAFVENILQPALEAVRRHFDVKPLIVRLPWREEFGFYPRDAARVFNGHH